jgi:hypothetical protein
LVCLAAARGAGPVLLALGAALLGLACGLGITGGDNPVNGTSSGSAALPPSGQSPIPGGTSGLLPDGAPAPDGEGGTVCETEPGLRFDGVDDVAFVDDDSDLDLNHPFTVEAWIRPSMRIELADAEMHIVSHHDHNDNSGWVFLIKAQRLELRLYGSNGASPQTAGEETPQGYVRGNTWAHVAGTWDGNFLRVYYTGERRDEEEVLTSYVRRPYTFPLTIGRAAYGTMFHFDGVIDDVRLSNILRYTGTTAPRPPGPLTSDDNTVALWKFDEASGRELVNARGMEHAGTLGTSVTSPSQPTRILTTCTSTR